MPIFGIDLGTTNSLIGTGDKLLSGLVSSNVDIAERKQVKRDILGDNIVASYKTNMSMGEDGQLSIQCSSVILKELMRIGERHYGESVTEAVISVPAYFQTSQREAVYKAAEIVGLEVKALINEPTAAALYVCKDIKDLVVVYDLGGGTFDVSIVDNRAGTYFVVATDGDNLGGDDLDTALGDDVIKDCHIPIRFRNKENLKRMKFRMRLAKEEIQKTRNTVYIDMSEFGMSGEYALTEEKYIEIIKKVFSRTIDMTNYLISEHIPSCESPSLILVGGSSNCPYLHDLVVESVEIKREITCDVNLDYVVAKGVALYAYLLHKGKAFSTVNDVTKRLCIEDETGKSITIIEGNSIVPCRNTITVYNSETDSVLRLKLYQGDSIVASKNSYIGTLEFDYGREVGQGEGIVMVTVEASINGIIKLSAYEVIYGVGSAQAISLTSR